MTDATTQAAEPASIGEAWMDPDGTITLRLRATAPNAIGESLQSYKPDNPQYNTIRDHLPGLTPGAHVPVPPFD